MGDDELIERARRLLDAITPGPWRGLPHTGTVMGPVAPVASDVDRPGNREFIAAAPDLVRDLLAELRDLVAERRHIPDDTLTLRAAADIEAVAVDAITAQEDSL